MVTKQNASLAEYTSLHAGGPAENLVIVENGDSLKDAVMQAVSVGKIWVLGYGANCLISDGGLEGTVIFNQAEKIEKIADTKLKVSSGTNWDNLVQYAIDNNLWGTEFTSGIPGGVGAAIAGNIAAYGQKVSDCLVEASVLNPRSGSVDAWNNDKFAFAYRTSSFQTNDSNSLVLLDATFELSQSPTGQLEYESALSTAGDMGISPDTLENRRKIIMETRRKAGSLLEDTSSGPWTAGSFFKNPIVNSNQVKAILAFDESGISQEKLLRQNQLHSGESVRISAAHVLLAAGFKRGQTWGQVRLHPEHVLKIENIGGAKAQEIYRVVQTIITTVKSKLGINLEPEVRILGKFY